MDNKGVPTKTKTWFIVLIALLDDIAALALVIIVLWAFDVEISVPVIIILILAVGAVIFLIHRAVVPSLQRRNLNGAEGMIGMIGEVTEPLKPTGTVKIKGEYWKAVCTEGDVDTGENVEVMRIKGLNLEVRKKE